MAIEYIFIASGLPDSNGKGYEKILHERLKLLPSGSSVTLLLCHSILSKKIKIGDTKLIYPNLDLQLSCPKFTFIDILSLIPKFIFGTPLQVLLHHRNSLESILKKIWLRNKHARVYCVMSRNYHKNIKLFDINLIDYIDSMQLNFERKAKVERNILKSLIYKIEAKRMRLWDQKICAEFNEAITVSSLDAEYIEKKKINVVPIGVDYFMGELSKLSERCGHIVFSGNMNYAPNIHAVEYFIKNCLPKLRELHGDVELHIVGRGLDEARKRWLSNTDGVVIVGEVDNMQETLASYRVSIAPMQSGSGMQFKIIEALSVGCVVVASEIAVAALKSKTIDALYVVNADESYVDILHKIFTDVSAYEDATTISRKTVYENYGWTIAQTRLKEFDFFQVN